ncbi:malectin domain-containing carbohydrate-binding protein, partial [Aurantibacter sp.]|uniref:malectin domain-containing carbohydrate-binding protein n=1 Tax=Aurantibacter sp. TaxID=2807103 RepID=UPI00326490B9
MKKITLLSILFFYTALSFGQTPCSNISTLDCSQVEVGLPLNLDFNGSQGGILATGFTMVDAPSSRLASDDVGADPDVPGLKSGNLSLSSGQLSVTATKGINYNQPSSSGNTNSQMNAIGIGLGVGSDVINIEATFAQPDFNSSTPDNKSQQAGIWFGLNENNFVKLVAVDRPGTSAQKFQLALEQSVGGATGSGTTMTINELNTSDISTNGVSNITLRISINPSTENVVGYYSLDGAPEVQVVGPGNSLSIPAYFLAGVDHDNNIGTDEISFAGIMTSTRNSTGGSLVISYDSFSVTEESTPFEAHVNFQNNPSFTVPPAGYIADYGKQFGNSTISVGVNDYQFGWKKASDGTAIDISNIAANGGTGANHGAGRNRISGTYSGASIQEKLEGTLIHFQGDNIISNTGGNQSWSGQPRGNETLWELEIPNGTYAVTVGLGDKDPNNIDSRHSATIEGYTIIPAFVPTPGQTGVETMIVEVVDGALTMNGLGGFNSKINYIDVVESSGTPVNGILAFSPNTISETIAIGAADTFSSSLSGAGATNIGLVINDNINAEDKTLTGENDWLTLPTTSSLGQFDFTMDATALAVNDTRNNKIIATAKGFKPAELMADVTVEAVVASTVIPPYRMNVAGQDYTKDGDMFAAENIAYLEETSGTTANNDPYDLVGVTDTDLYHPRRYGADFSYNFPIANGEYTVALHMIENFHDAAGIRVFDVEIEGNPLIGDLDLVASYGKGVLALQSYDVIVSDGELNIDFTASANNAIVQAIEILPVALNDEKEILSFTLANETGAATIDDTAKTVNIEVSNGTLLTNLVPTITLSEDATISPASGVEQDFTDPINYTVTAEDTSEQVWTVTVSEAPSTATDILTFVFAEQTGAATIDATAHTITVEVANGTLLTGLVPTISISDDATISPESGLAQDFENTVDYTVTAEDETTAQLWQVTVTEAAATNTAPSITSAATASVLENQTAAIEVEVTDDNDVEGPGLQFSLTGTIDDSLFNIDIVSGEVAFIDVPDFENPVDAGGDNIYNIEVTVTDSGSLTAAQSIAITVTEEVETPASEFSFIENFSYTPGQLKAVSGGAWDPEDNTDGSDKQDILVVAEALTDGTTHALNIENLNTTVDYITLIDNPVDLVANVPFYFGTYFQFSEISTATNSPRVRVAIRVDDADSGNEWVRQIIGRYGGDVKARLGLSGPNSNAGQQDVYPNQLFQFVVKGVWNGTDTITYEYTISPALSEGATAWISASASQSATSGTPSLGRIFISSTNTDNTGKIGPIRLSTDYNEVVTELIDSKPYAAFTAEVSDLTVDLDATTSLDDGTISSFAWDFGDGNTGNGETTSHTYISSGDYTVSLTVTDNSGNTAVFTEEITVEAPFVASFPYQINFQDELTNAPAGYVKDFGEAYGLRDNGLTYGWIKLSDGQPIDLTTPSTGTGRNREVAGVDLLLNTLVHIQGNDIPSWVGTNRGNEGVWEVALENGWYEVTVSVGDPSTDSDSSDSPVHYINVEGETAIPIFIVDFNLPEGDPGRFQTNTVIVEVQDGKLTIDADDAGAFRTKINFATIAEASDPRSTENDLLSFELSDQTGAAVIDVEDHTVIIEVENGTDFSTLSPTITISDEATIDPLAGLNTDLEDGSAIYTITAENGTEQQWFVTVTELIETETCNPFSPLPCNEIVTNLPVSLNFDGTGAGLDNTGFTMVDPYSGLRVSEDGIASDSNFPSYEPSNLALTVTDNLIITANKGIAYLENNAQINTLGLGLQNITTPLVVEAKLVGITTGANAAQAGIWFGIDDENFVKLNVNNDNIEMRREIGGLSANGATSLDQIQVNNVGVSGNDVTLRLVINPDLNTITAYYAIDEGAFIQVTKASANNLELPTVYMSGKTVSAEIGNASFAGVYSTYRNGASFNAEYDYFSITPVFNQPIIDDQSFTISEDAAINDIVGTVVATDDQTLSYSITSGNDAGTFAIDETSGEISVLTALSFENTPQYIVTVAVNDGTNSASAEITIDVTEVIETEPCSPISTLDCDEIETLLPLSLDFTVANGNLSDSGLTMVLEPSARLASDDALAHLTVPGYAPSLITQDASGLSIISTKGIFYNQPVGSPNSNNTNSQMNALGTGMVVPSGVFSITSTLENPDFSVSETNNSQQAGIWFGLDEDYYMKLAILKTGNTTRKVQLQVENMDETTTATAFLEINTGNIASNTGDIKLRMEIDPINSTVKGYYSLNGGAEILVSDSGADFLAVPEEYFEGTTFDTSNPSEVLNFAGIFTTHRNAAVDQSITAVFKDFEIIAEEVALELAFNASELNFIGNVGTTIPVQTTLLSSTSGSPTVIFSDDPDAMQWLVLPSETEVGEVTFTIKENVPAGNYSTTVFAIDEPELGYENASITINLEVREIQTPLVVGISPTDGATGVSVNASISANDLFLPNFDEIGNTGVDNNSISNSTVKIYKEGNTTPIASTANGTGGGDAISIVPSQPLEANTTYVVEIDGVLDVTGEPFAFFTSSFTTGGGGGGPTTDLDNVSFENAGAVASGAKYSTLTIGPDGKLYGLEIDGDIHRWDMNVDGTLTNEEVLNSWKSSYGSRAAIGFTFDPDATANNLIVYITHQSGALNNAPSWDGKISRLTGVNLEIEDLVVTNLPRSKKDHLTNSIAFKSGEPDVLYFNQGSNSAAGAPDNAWGNRKERLLSASALRLDLNKLPEGQWPLNAKTTMDPVAINNVNTNSPTLTSTVANYTEDGQTYADDGTYNPYYTNAPLTLFATGIRNAYDLVWHSNGQLYVPTNGTAGGSNAPASIDGTRRPDGSFYDHSNPLYPVIPASNGNNVQHDWLFRIDPNSSIGFYGHPNPLRGEFVLNRGDADVNNAVYNGITADVNYRGDAFDFEFNKSPNGVIEYRSNAENGNLQGAILVVRYSGGSDIIALVPDGTNGDISTFKEGIPGFSGFNDPLDLTEDINTGNIYVSDYGSSNIILLKPSNQSTPKAVIVVNTDDFTGDAVTNGSNQYSEEITLSNLGNATLNNISAQITGADASQFSFSGLPSSIAAQNSGSFLISFDPTSNGPKYAELTLSGTDADPVIISLSGLGKVGTGGSNEPSLQWILNTQLGEGVVNVGDTNTTTNLIDLESGSAYNDILGDEVAVQKFERASDAPVTLEVLSVYGPEANNPIVAFGWYESGNVNSVTEVFNIENTTSNNGQTLNPIVNGALSFDPGIQSFGFVSRWPFFNDRQLFSEDALNIFSGAIPHHVRVYELPGEDNAYIIATEEHVSGFDYQDIVVIARNIKPYDDTPAVACSPISTLDCDELEVTLPFMLEFDGTEGGLSNTGFTMVDNPSERIPDDGPISNLNVPGYEPSQLSILNGNLIINANKGISYIKTGTGAGTSTEVNSQINTLGVGIDASSYGNFSIATTIVNPYTDADADSEQAGVWFGLNEDNFVKLIANSTSQIELRTELQAVSANTSQVITTVPNLNSSTVQLRLYVDVENSQLTAFYSLNGGTEILLGSLPLPSAYVSGNVSYDNLSFAGVFATKRREDAATEVAFTLEDFSITPDNIVTFEPVNINFSLPEDVPPAGYLVDSGLDFADRGNTYSYGWLTTDGQTTLDLSQNARNREVTGVDILQNTLMHMQYGDVGNGTGTSGVLTEGIWEIAVPNGSYTVSVGVGDPNLDTGNSNDIPSHTINVEGVNIINQYVPSGAVGTATRFTSGSATVTVTDGRLTIDADGGHNTKINSLSITDGGAITEPFFTNVTPSNNATNVAITDFQINVEVVTPVGYELDKTTYAGNVNLYEVTAGGEVLVPSNSNDTGGGDAITLTPLSTLKTFTTYVFRLTDDIEANLVGDTSDRLAFAEFESQFTTGDEDTVAELDLTGVEFTKVPGGVALGDGTANQRFSSLVIGPDGKLYASTIGNFNSDGKIYRWDMAADGTLENLEILSPELQGAVHPEDGARSNNDRLIIGLAFDPASTAENLIAYITHSTASVTNGPEWDGVLSKLTGPTLSNVEDLIIHLPRSGKDHLTNSIEFDLQGDMFISQGSNTAGGDPDPNWVNRPERLLAGAILKVELDKLPSTLPLSAYTTDNIGVINSATSGSLTMSDGTYNPFATNAPITIFATGVRNAYDLVWHSNGWLYVPTNGTAGNNNNSPNSPSTDDYALARRIDGLTSIPDVPSLTGGETQKDWLFKTQGGSYHGHPNPYRGEFVLNHGGAPYSGLPGQEETSYTDVAKYPNDLGPDPNYREPAFDFGKNKSPNGAIEYQSNAFGGKLQGLLMVVRFSGQDDLLVMQPKTNGDIGNVNGDVPGLGGFDDPLDVIEDPKTGNIYISEYDRDNNGTPKLTLLRATVPATIGPEIAATPDELIFEITVNNEGENADTKTVSVTNDGNAALNISGATISGEYADQFDAVQPSGTVSLAPGESQVYTITYAPDLNGSNLGYQEASLVVSSDDEVNPSFEIGLHALKKAGFEGGEEPNLQDVVDALGIGVNVGWTSLANGTNPAPSGDESEVELWVKASDAPIKVTPVGRYSPAEELPFGWYTNVDGVVTTNEVGVLEGQIENAQTLFPPIVSGADEFDPLGAVFGFYVDSNSFQRINYSEDALNAIQPTGVTHRTRIYPMADREGNPIANSFLIAFEDASNGDYQDYMFIIDNVIPYEDGTLVLDFSEDEVTFVASINQEEIPTQEVVLSGNGGLTSGEINLIATEDWVVLPTSFDVNSSFEIGVDVSGLSIGTYQASINASAPNYEDASITINLNVTNELVYVYQFNFQDADDVAVSPQGYIDDLGVPYGVQTTSIGDFTFGWVEPGTLEPADAAVNGRNRDGDALLSTFTIIGHNSTATYPQRDWIVNVPNGSYSVNISVGDPDYSDSNHVLDVNGVTILNYNQETTAPDDFENFEQTSMVEVTDGTLRLSLGAGGANAKPNYIRLAPIDTSLLLPTIVADFDGNSSAADTYRGEVSIALSAIDESESGSIVRLEYILDDNTLETYNAPLNVVEVGSHVLVVTAEDANGNISEETYNFTIETPSGALLALENMTKIPGTNRGFPADDYYTFHRLGNPGQAEVHDSNVMRLNNSGTGPLVVTAINITDANDYSYELLDNTGAAATLPITIETGSYADLDITFIGGTSTAVNGIFVESIEIISNADNALENEATLHGAYSPQPEGGDEINAQEVFDAFGFESSMLSIVNDEGSITPANTLPYRPSSNYPIAENIDAGYEGDLILSSTFVQADPSKPVIGIQISALHGGPSSNGAKFVQADGTGTVGGINFSHDGTYYQTLLPRKGEGINYDTATSIGEPFRIAISNYLTSGGNNISGNRPDLLGARVYKVIDHNGKIIPNEYIVLQDFVQGGCGAGSANCDWNDNTFYFINIRPEAVPTAQPIADLFVAIDELFTIDSNEYFDRGYPGNILEITATANGEALPAWIHFDPTTGIFEGTPPIGTTGSYSIILAAEDVNGLTASTSFEISISEPPVATDDSYETEQNLAINLELLNNDSDPNEQVITIVSVENPLNGLAELNVDGTEVLYTPGLDYIGSDSFSYTIEDETGLQATASVSITINEVNQAPVAIITTNTIEGPAALYVDFDGSGSTDDNNNIVSYLWDFGDLSGTSTDAVTNYTYNSAGVYQASLTVTDNLNLSHTTNVTITVTGVGNTAPNAVASVTPIGGSNTLQFNFDGSASNDTESGLTYEWNFGDGTPVSTIVETEHTYDIAGIYTVTLKVTDAGNLTDTFTIDVEAKDSVINDFSLRINAGGPELTHNGEVFATDQYFTGGKAYENTSATVTSLYQTERSSDQAAFEYDIPLADGEYSVVLHFAEIYWGANGGGAAGVSQRVFDVIMEENTILDDYDINADVGSQTAVSKTYDVIITDGELNLVFDATGSDGVNQPKLSAIEIFGSATAVNELPIADAGDDKTITLPTNSVELVGSGTDSDGTIDSYAWTKVSGPNGESLN